MQACTATLPEGGTTVTRRELAILLENEAQNAAAEDIRSGVNAQVVCTLAMKRSPRYDDAISREAVATFEAVARGELVVTD